MNQTIWKIIEQQFLNLVEFALFPIIMKNRLIMFAEHIKQLDFNYFQNNQDSIKINMKNLEKIVYLLEKPQNQEILFGEIQE